MFGDGGEGDGGCGGGVDVTFSVLCNNFGQIMLPEISLFNLILYLPSKRCRPC